MAQIIQMPRTGEGRRALREALFILRNCGPAPDGSHATDVDWDSLVAEVDEAFRSSRESARK